MRFHPHEVKVVPNGILQADDFRATALAIPVIYVGIRPTTAGGHTCTSKYK